MFAGKNMLLGDGHQVDPDVVGIVPCGAACPHRLNSITCPFFRAPCLVGCTVKQVMSGEGMQYEEQDFFVVAQAGRDLIGEEVVVSLDNPRSLRLRIIKDKRGRNVHADDGLSGSLLDGMEFNERPDDWAFLEKRNGEE